MTLVRQRSVVVLFLSALCYVSAKVPVVSPLRVNVPSVGDMTAGCSLCRDSGNCSIAVNNTSSGVFCGDLKATAMKTQPCCCAFYTECRATSKSQTCECGGAWPIATYHKRHSVNEVATETDSIMSDPMANQISATTEIFIHLSAYLAFFVFAVYVDQWVECFSDFRRNQMVVYSDAVDIMSLRFRQRFGKRRRDPQADTGTDDRLPLLVMESPAPTATPVFTFDVALDADSSQKEVEKQEPASVTEHIVVVTVDVDVVRETDISPECPTDLEEISLE